jgi:hypothetical protein
MQEQRNWKNQRGNFNKQPALFFKVVAAAFLTRLGPRALRGRGGYRRKFSRRWRDRKDDSQMERTQNQGKPLAAEARSHGASPLYASISHQRMVVY